MNTQRITARGSSGAGVSGTPLAANLFAPWQLVERLGIFHFQDGMTVTRWRGARASGSAGAVAPISSGGNLPAADHSGLILIETVAATQAILHEQAFTAWREAALWRRLYPEDGFAEVLDLPTASDQFAVVQRLPAQARAVLMPAQPDGFRPADSALGRALPERSVIAMLRKLLETVEFLLAKSRSLGPAPSPAALLDGIYVVPDLSAPRVKLATSYAGLPGSPDQHGRRHLGPILAVIGRVLLTGQYETGSWGSSSAGGTNNASGSGGSPGGVSKAVAPTGLSGGALVHQTRLELTTQLPAWIDAMEKFDGGSGGAVKLVAQFDQFIAQIKSDVVSEIYRPLG